jgi:hypothetical protein
MIREKIQWQKYLLAFKVQEHLILNLLGAIIPAIKLSNKPENESFLFIADFTLHYTNKNGATLRATVQLQHGSLAD